jgi:glycosyltransferase involved in cell wall biosynthesis
VGVSAPLRIGIDLASWINCRGYGRFTRELIAAVIRRDTRNRYVFFLDREAAAAPDIPAGPDRVIIATSVAPTRAASADGSRSVADLLRMSLAVARRPLDLFFFPTNYTYFPMLTATPVIVAIHDATTALHPELIFPSARSRFFWRAKEWLSIRQARALVTVSENAKDAVARNLGVARERISVLPEAASPCFRARSLGRAEIERLRATGASPENGYVLHVGGVSPHKNLPRLVRAFAAIARDPRHAQLRLVLAGDTGGQDVFYSSLAEVRELVERERLADRVVLTGYLEDELLALLYNGATALAFPSFNEGFGLPAVEAMASGTPVAASRAGSLPEVLGDAAVFFDPANEEEMTRVLRDIVENAGLRARLRDAGLARAREFSWDRAAEILIALFERTARRGRVNGA